MTIEVGTSQLVGKSLTWNDARVMCGGIVKICGSALPVFDQFVIGW